MKVNKTTEACKAYNETNADAIGSGLMDAWEPDDAMLKQEARQKAQAKSEADFHRLAGQFWMLVMTHLSAEDAKVFEMPQLHPHLSYLFSNDNPSTTENVYLKSRGEVEAFNSHGRYSSLGTPKLRVVLGEYGDAIKRKDLLPYKPNDIIKLSTDTEFAKKVAEKLSARIAANRTRRSAQLQGEQYSKKKNKVYEDNKEFFNSIGIYGSDLSLDNEGNIMIKIQIKGDIDRIKNIAKSLAPDMR